MIVLHGLKTCDTCRRALGALRTAGREARLRDLRQEPPAAAEIADWLTRLGPGLLNVRSTTWRGLPAAERDGAPEDLLLAHPALIKRPVVETGDGLFLGWTPEVRGALAL